MVKKLWIIFGPLVVAAFMLIALLFSPFKINTINSTTEKQASTSLSANIIKGDAIKKAALSTDYYVPFFGSSEFSRFDLSHPSVMAEKYDLDFRPFLMGNPGTQSLTHYFQIQGISSNLKKKKAVVVISPQWFVKQGTDPQAFRFYFSKLQAVNFLKHQKGSKSDQYAASRLLEMLKDTDGVNEHIINDLQRVAKGRKLSHSAQLYLKYYGRLLAHEDQFFSKFRLKEDNQSKINKQLHALPDDYSEKEINRTINRQARKETSSNKFGIKNSFYQHRLKHRIKSFKDKERNFNYTKSPEFADFQLLLNQFAQNDMDVLFVIPPVNQKWADYVGLPQSMLMDFNHKIKYQLQSQGFNNVADLSTEGNQPYFMQDTIHLGWHGWYTFDKKVESFMDEKSDQPKYKINNYFLEKAWQNEIPSQIGTQQENKK